MTPYNFATDNWLQGGGNEGEWDRLHASSYVAYLGGAIYEIPAGYAPAGEPFEHALSTDEEPSIWIPLLKGGEEGYTDYLGDPQTAYSLVPCLHQLDLETRELIAEHVLLPDRPEIELPLGGVRYRNAVPYRGLPANISGSIEPDTVGVDVGILDSLRTPGVAAWGTIGDCGGGGLYEILLIDDWAIPRISKSNQLYAINLVTGARYVRRGWRDHGVALAEVRPDDPHGVDWSQALTMSYESFAYSVLGRSVEGRILVATEQYRVEPKIRSDVGGQIEWTDEIPGCARPVWPDEEERHPSEKLYLGPGMWATMRDSLVHKWVFHPSGDCQFLDWGGGVKEENLHLFYDAYHPTEWFTNCGTTAGTPWLTLSWEGPLVPDGGACRNGYRDSHVFRDSLKSDIEQLISRPIWRGMVATLGEWDISEWQLPATGGPVNPAIDYRERSFPALTYPQLTGGEPRYYAGEKIVREANVYGTREMKWADLNTVPNPDFPGLHRVVGEMWADDYLEVGGETWEPPTFGIWSWRDDFSNVDGVGTLLHHAHNGWSANSGVCPIGPGGPWITDALTVDNVREVHATQIWAPAREVAKLPPPPPHGLLYACDGERLYFLPRRQNLVRFLDNPTNAERSAAIAGGAAVVAIDLALGTVVWSVSLADEIGEIRNVAGNIEPHSGGCRSNPVIVADRLYLVAWGPDGDYLVALNRHTGEFELTRRLTGFDLGTYPAVTYRDELVIVSAAVAPESPTGFFTISIA